MSIVERFWGGRICKNSPTPKMPTIYSSSLQGQIAGYGIPETPARCKARLIEALQNGEKEMEVPVQTLHANNELTYAEVKAFCKRFDGTDTGKARVVSSHKIFSPAVAVHALFAPVRPSE